MPRLRILEALNFIIRIDDSIDLVVLLFVEIELKVWRFAYDAARALHCPDRSMLYFFDGAPGNGGDAAAGIVLEEPFS